MKIEFRLFNGPTDWGWVQSVYPMLRISDMCGIMAIDLEKDEPVACALFDTFLAKTAQVSLIITNSMVLRHGFFEEVCQFAFDGMGRDYVFSKVSANNIKAQRINKRAGFKEVGRLRGATPDGKDHIMMELSKEDCAFYEPFEKEEVA